ECGVVDIDVNGFCADVGDGPTGGDEGEGRSDDFIAGADAENDHGHVERGSAAVESDAMLSAQVFGEVLFELDDIGSEAEGTIIEGAGDGRIEVRAQTAYLRRQIEIRNRFAHRTLIFVQFELGINRGVEELHWRGGRFFYEESRKA